MHVITLTGLVFFSVPKIKMVQRNEKGKDTQVTSERGKKKQLQGLKMMILFSFDVVKRLKSDWIRGVSVFGHIIMSPHKLKNSQSLGHYEINGTSFE